MTIPVRPIPLTDLVSLLSAASATGSGKAVTAGYYNWSVYGTWDGATAQLQWSPDDSTYINIDGAAETANGGRLAIPMSGGYARVLITGAGGSTSLTSNLGGVA